LAQLFPAVFGYKGCESGIILSDKIKWEGVGISMKKISIALVIISLISFVGLFIDNTTPLSAGISISNEDFRGWYNLESGRFSDDSIHIRHEIFSGTYNIETKSMGVGARIKFSFSDQEKNTQELHAFLDEISELAKTTAEAEAKIIKAERRTERIKKYTTWTIINVVLMLCGVLMFVKAWQDNKRTKSFIKSIADSKEENLASANEDWKCASCGYINDSRRRECKSCEKPRK
jgi:hypothetical protein